jgi:K+-sensing histidine kinase KdpD
MSGGQFVLVVLDAGAVQEDAMRYALELAQRLQCRPSALVLAGPSLQAAEQVVDCARRVADRLVAERGAPLEIVARPGDRASELLKRLAELGSVRALVWAGEPSALTARRRATGGAHWLARVGAHVGCPVVTAAARAGRSKDERHNRR